MRPTRAGCTDAICTDAICSAVCCMSTDELHERISAPHGAFPRYERLLLGLLGIDEFLLLHRAPAGWRPSTSASAAAG